MRFVSLINWGWFCWSSRGVEEKFAKFSGEPRDARRISWYITHFRMNFEQNCHQNTKQDSGRISNFCFRFKNRSSFRNPKLIFKIEAAYSSRIPFRDIKMRYCDEAQCSPQRIYAVFRTVTDINIRIYVFVSATVHMLVIVCTVFEF